MPACTDCKYFTQNNICSDTGHFVPSITSIQEDISCDTFVFSISALIERTIQDEIANTRWGNCWLSRAGTIRDKIQELKPTKPEDETIGFIAFDVPNKTRMKLKTQRFLTRKLHLNNGYLPDHYISSIANKINSKLFPDIKIELINSKKITEAYRKSVGNGSCMTEDACEYTRLYEMNPDKIQMLTMYYMSDSARAIVYKLDNGKYYLDKVYTSCNLLNTKMQNYADKHDWCSRPNLDDLSDEEKQNLVISNLTFEEGCVPYMDTFGGSVGNGKLTLSYRNYDYDLDTQNGCIEESRYTCEWCEDDVDEDDLVCIGDNRYCEACVNENFTYCEHCDSYCNNDDSVYIVDRDIYVCDYCAKQHYTQCEDCENYNKEDYVTIEDSGKCVCNNCTNKYTQCEKCGGWFEAQDVNEDRYCEGCEPEDSKAKEDE